MSKKTAITFPGQGSQSVGIPADLAAAYPLIRWVEILQAIGGRGVEIVMEAVPGKVRKGLIKRLDKSLPALPVFDPASLDTAMESINA